VKKVAAKAGDYSFMVGENNSLGSRTECLCSVSLQHYDVVLSPCYLGVVMCETPHLFERYWLSLEEISSSTSYVNNGRL
jgi:hypothetical protein